MTEPGTTKGLLPLARRTRWLRAGLGGGGAAGTNHCPANGSHETMREPYLSYLFIKICSKKTYRTVFTESVALLWIFKLLLSCCEPNLD